MLVQFKDACVDEDAKKGMCWGAFDTMPLLLVSLILSPHRLHAQEAELEMSRRNCFNISAARNKATT